MNGLWLRAAGAGRQCAPAALGGRFSAAAQLHRKRMCGISFAPLCVGGFAPSLRKRRFRFGWTRTSSLGLSPTDAGTRRV